MSHFITLRGKKTWTVDTGWGARSGCSMVATHMGDAHNSFQKLTTSKVVSWSRASITDIVDTTFVGLHVLQHLVSCSRNCTSVLNLWVQFVRCCDMSLVHVTRIMTKHSCRCVDCRRQAMLGYKWADIMPHWALSVRQHSTTSWAPRVLQYLR